MERTAEKVVCGEYPGQTLPNSRPPTRPMVWALPNPEAFKRLAAHFLQPICIPTNNVFLASYSIDRGLWTCRFSCFTLPYSGLKMPSYYDHKY